ncbi:Uncharacterised protein [Chlamydia trachomatis]|nr:Uncharacterised protein [Chlamydia trachomatis]
MLLCVKKIYLLGRGIAMAPTIVEPDFLFSSGVAVVRVKIFPFNKVGIFVFSKKS